MMLPFPEHEIDAFLAQLDQASLLRSSIRDIERIYLSSCLRVIPNRMDDEITNILIGALTEQQPMAAIRIGDGEGNLLAYKQYPGTPELDRYCADQIISRQEDKFSTSDAWLLRLQQLLFDAVMEADLIGVRGLDWWSCLAEASHELTHVRRKIFLENPRGIQGLMRSEDYMLRLASQNLLGDKIIASAHFYIGILRSIRPLLVAAPRIVLISSWLQLPSILSQIVPHTPVFFIPVGRARLDREGEELPPAPLRDTPDFLDDMTHRLNQLGSLMRGALCMIGAGPWSELYCVQAKHCGAVAVDLGSGLDLLIGRQTRPIHSKFISYLPDFSAIF